MSRPLGAENITSGRLHPAQRMHSTGMGVLARGQETGAAA